jgi:hypothetical protein
MQRMLALPVNELEDELKPAAEGPTTTVAESPLPSPRSFEPVPPLEECYLPEPLVRLDPPSDLAGPATEPPRAPSLWLTTATDGEASLSSTPDDFATERRERAEESPPEPPPDSEIKSAAEHTEEEWERSLPVSPEVLDAISPSSGGKKSDRPFGRAQSPSPEAFPVPNPVDAPPVWIQPLVWTNRAFDAGTRWLGPLGGCIRSPGGRAILGWAGLGLLAGALGWLGVHELGWTW